MVAMHNGEVCSVFVNWRTKGVNWLNIAQIAIFLFFPMPFVPSCRKIVNCVWYIVRSAK